MHRGSVRLPVSVFCPITLAHRPGSLFLRLFLFLYCFFSRLIMPIHLILSRLLFSLRPHISLLLIFCTYFCTVFWLTGQDRYCLLLFHFFILFCVRDSSFTLFMSFFQNFGVLLFFASFWLRLPLWKNPSTLYGVSPFIYDMHVYFIICQ